MAFLNTPLKSVQANITSIIGVETMPWYNPLNFPVAPLAPQPLPIAKDFRWRVVMNIDQQLHSAFSTRSPGSYNGQDVTVGQWIANLSTGQAWQIISIESKSVSQITAIVQDVYRYNTFRDPAQTGNGSPNAGTYVVFNIGDTGVPEIDPVPPSGVSSTFGINIQSRFQYINLQYDYPLYAAGNTFTLNDTVAASSLTHSFVLADAENRTVIGRITSISDTISGWFTINPVQKVVDNLNYLPGNVADVIYSSLTTPGAITLIPGGSELYIKLRNNTSSISTSTLSGPTSAGAVLRLNDVNITPGSPYGINELVTATNLNSVMTGVTSASVLSPTFAQTDNLLIAPLYGEPVLWASSSPASVSINGTTVVFNITSADAGYTDYARPAQMAQSINAAHIPDIVASTPSALVLLITNVTGGSINITNIVPDINSINFAGTASGAGVALFTPASTQPLIRFTAVDARAINFLDVVGSPVGDFGLISVENGIKACGLYIEEGLRNATSVVVTDLAALGGLKPFIGDQAYVINSVDAQGNNAGEWSMWLYDGNVWVQTSNKDSASTDAKSLEYTLNVLSPASINIGSISTGRRITLITVEVTAQFDTVATLDIGYQVNNPVPPPAVPAGLMSQGIIDLTVVGTYSTSTDILFGVDTVAGDVSITASFSANSALLGTAKIIVSYV